MLKFEIEPIEKTCAELNLDLDRLLEIRRGVNRDLTRLFSGVGTGPGPNPKQTPETVVIPPPIFRHKKIQVLNDTGRRYYGQIIWNCLCDCGRTLELRQVQLKKKCPCPCDLPNRNN